MEYTDVTAAEFTDLDGFDDWRFVLGAIRARFRLPSFPAGGALVAKIADAAEDADHHPDVDLHYPGVVQVVLTTHAAGGVTDADVDLARTISELAREMGAVSDVLTSQTIEVAIDTMDADRIRPFWAAVLGYRESNGKLIDPTGTGPSFWFQQSREPRTERSRFHVDVDVAHDLAEQRVADTVTAGGRLVTDEFAPSWWVLADADGNEACICTWQNR